MSATGENLVSPLIAARRIVVKVGSALLVDPETGHLRRAWLTGLVEDLMRLRARGSTGHPRVLRRHRPGPT
jgi:hypothetical protein